MVEIVAKPLTALLFKTYGEVIEQGDEPTMMINQGNCARYHNLATLDIKAGQAGISVFHAKPYSMPLELAMMERHPIGSQAFIPLNSDPFLIVVAQDVDDSPSTPVAFVTNGRQGVNYRRNTWHGVLTPLAGNGLFAVVDRIGEGENLQEHWFTSHYQIKI